MCSHGILAYDRIVRAIDLAFAGKILSALGFADRIPTQGAVPVDDLAYNCSYCSVAISTDLFGVLLMLRS